MSFSDPVKLSNFPPAKYQVGNKVTLHSDAVKNEYGCQNSIMGNNTWTVDKVTPQIMEWEKYDVHTAMNVPHSIPTYLYTVAKTGGCYVVVKETDIKKKVEGGKRKTKKRKRKIKKSRKSRKLKRRKTRRC
jgi:hypothetical protein